MTSHTHVPRACLPGHVRSRMRVGTEGSFSREEFYCIFCETLKEGTDRTCLDSYVGERTSRFTRSIICERVFRNPGQQRFFLLSAEGKSKVVAACAVNARSLLADMYDGSFIVCGNKRINTFLPNFEKEFLRHPLCMAFELIFHRTYIFIVQTRRTYTPRSINTLLCRNVTEFTSTQLDLIKTFIPRNKKFSFEKR